MATVEIKETQLINEYGSGYGWEVKAIVKDGDYRDGIDILVEQYGEEMLYNHQGDVWNQFRWKVIVK